MGVFISMEGGDGSGKGTQASLLNERLVNDGYDVFFESYPRYDEPVAAPIGMYLNGVFGPDVHPILASMPYTLDRLKASPKIRDYKARKNGIYLADRFDDSNDGHQGAKYDTREEKVEFFEYQHNYEHVVLGVPEPDKTILFLVPPDVAQANIDRKGIRSYTTKTRDIHEADPEHLRKAFETYSLMAELNPDRILVVDPMKNRNEMLPVEVIHEKVVDALRPLLLSLKAA